MTRVSGALILFLWTSCLSEAAVNMKTSYKEGESLGQAEKGFFNESQVREVAGYKTPAPLEASFYNDRECLNTKAAKLLHGQKDDAGSLLLETEKTRGKMIIDPETDPLIKKSDEIINNPGTAVESIEGDIRSSSSSMEQFCYESGERAQKKCTLRRVIVLKEIPPRILNLRLIVQRCSRNPAYGGHQEASFNFITGEQGGLNLITVNGEKFDPTLKDRVRHIFLHPIGNVYVVGNVLYAPKRDQYTKKKLTFGSKTEHAWIWDNWNVSIDIEYDPLPTENDIIETIEDSCASLERLSDKGTCHYGKESILEGEETRQFKELSVKRPWWVKQRTYYCGVSSKNDCDQWRKRGCYQVNSICHRPSRKGCLEWKQTFQCPGATRNLPTSSLAGKDMPFGLDGSCANQTWKANEDMTEVLTKLSLLQELKKENLMTKGQVFQGNTMDCSKHCLNFSDCCALSAGWGESLKLTSCSSSEKLLAQKRGEGKCHLVGTYCAEKEKVTKICLKKKTTFCCYESKLARVVQEGARTQLGLGWGTPKAPSCRALTVEEFSKINFDQINFSEAFKDVLANVKLPDSSKILTNFQKNWKTRLPSSADLRQSPDIHSIETKISERQSSVSKSTPGGYSLNENPPRPNAEVTQPQVVF